MRGLQRLAERHGITFSTHSQTGTAPRPRRPRAPNSSSLAVDNLCKLLADAIDGATDCRGVNSLTRASVTLSAQHAALILNALIDQWTLGLHQPERRPKVPEPAFSRTLDDLQRYARGRVIALLVEKHQLSVTAAKEVTVDLLGAVGAHLEPESLPGPVPHDGYLSDVHALLGRERLIEFGLGPEVAVLELIDTDDARLHAAIAAQRPNSRRRGRPRVASLRKPKLT